MNVRIFFDFSCPFSYLGGENYLQYLDKESLNPEDVTFTSFQLSPHKENTNTDFLKNMTEKFKLHSRKETLARYQSIIKMGSQLNLDYQIEKVIDTNSYLAHVGLQYAKEYKLASPYFRKVMSGHWSEGKDFSDMDYIKEVLNSIGLDTDYFEEHLSNYHILFLEDIALGKKHEIKTVPTFMNDNHRISGIGSYMEFRNLNQD